MLVRSVVDRLGPSQDVSDRLRDAAAYWQRADQPDWAANSHWRGGLSDEAWRNVGNENLGIFRKLVVGLGEVDDFGIVIDWGCGGGANAVAFAGYAERIIVADVSSDSVEESLARVREACATPVDGLIIDIEHPEIAAKQYAGVCDTFLCIYVIELTAGKHEALRIVDAAKEVLKPGGIAMFQVKYSTKSIGSRSAKRAYARNLASMTTFAIDEFWCALADRGLTPHLVTLVPENELDSRYAYFAAVKPVPVGP